MAYLTENLKADHILPDANYEASPFFDDRDDESDISLLVIHCISLPAKQFGLPYIRDLFLGRLDCIADDSFQDLQGLQVSAHLLIDRAGKISQFVPFNKRAWHAGVSEYGGRNGCNQFSIGIELEGFDDIAYTDAQYQALSKTSQWLLQQYPKITPLDIVGHSDIAPGRKTDPGPAFDWQRFRKSLGLSKLG